MSNSKTKLMNCTGLAMLEKKMGIFCYTQLLGNFHISLLKILNEKDSVGISIKLLEKI